MSNHLNSKPMNSVEVGNSIAPLAVQETGGALRVHTDTPHLVSLGGGRLSTAVTLHPLPPGRVTIGCGNHVDIQIHGTGVEKVHCHIENVNGVVTLYPVAQGTTIDGLSVVSPTRLAQGVIVTIGRSNYMRFNHPAEAQLMKSVLPNPRISMGPIQFYPTSNDQSKSNINQNRKPPVAPKKSPSSPHTSWNSEDELPPEEHTILSKVSKFELFASQNLKKQQYHLNVSPKVFPSDLVTVNTPARDVLGKSPIKNFGNLTTLNNYYEKNNSIKNNARVLENGCIPKINLMSQSMTTYNNTSPELKKHGSNPNLSSEAKNNENKLHSPSPYFNRNPPLYRNNILLSSSTTAVVSPIVAPHKQINELPGNEKNGSLCELSKVNNDQVEQHNLYSASIEDLTQRNSNAELKRHKAQEERVREQEIEKAEQARLEEILSMCAEYEKQAQCERVSTKTSVTPNRIKTNGSLPRDKRSPNTTTTPPSTTNHHQFMNEEPIFKFDFDTINQEQSKQNWCVRNNLNSYENVSINKFPASTPPPSAQTESTKQVETKHHGYENVILHPQSPRTRIKTYVTANKPEQNGGTTYKSDISFKDDYDFQNDSFSNLNQTPPSFQMLPKTSTPNGISKVFMNDNLVHEMANLTASVLKDHNRNESLSRNGSLNRKQLTQKEEAEVEEKRKHIEQLTNERNEIQSSISNIKRKIAEIEIQEEELLQELEVEKSLIYGEYRSEKSALKELEKGKAALQERAKSMELEMENCRIEQEKQQADTKNKLDEAQENVTRLQSKLDSLDNTSSEYNEIFIELTKAHDTLENERKYFEDLEFHHLEEEANLLATREELQREIQDLSQKIDERKTQLLDLEAQKSEALAHSTEESKSLERTLIGHLRHLEEHRNRLKLIDSELESLTGQKLDYYSDNEILSDDDSDSLKSQLKNKLENIKLLKNQLSSMEKENIQETKSSQMSQSFHEMYLHDKSSPDSKVFPKKPTPEFLSMSVSVHESLLKFGGNGLTQECKSPSQDDIDRISKVTLDAPMDLGENTGSLGRKTIESLKEIERNRQIHLVQQGSVVIEEERKRVSELKRRVQDEVRAQWEERRQRECNSLNSVGSEESARTSSEGNSGITRESVAESEDADDKTKLNVTFGSTHIHNDTQRRNSQQDSADSSDRRPLSESSDLSYDSQLTVKPRPRRSISSPQQRPLTRYLPIRNDNLNLRVHIESAGHQIDLCPHVILDSTTCRGYLSKMGSRFHSWNKRWFVFDRMKRTFVYYPDRNEKKHRGGAYFKAIEEVYLDHLNSVKSPYPQLTFIVKTHERSYHLMAPSPEAMRIWIDVIFTGAEGYQEFEHGT